MGAGGKVADIKPPLVSALTLWGLAVLVLILSSGCSGGRTAHAWRLQTHASPGNPDYGALERMAGKIGAMSGGRLTVTILPSGTIASGPDIYSAVRDGQVELGNGWPNWWTGQHPAWAVMNSGPFEFMGLEASIDFFLHGPGTAFANDLSLPAGVMWRPAWWEGMEFGLMTREPLGDLRDLAGKRVRIGPGLAAEVFAEATGATTISTVAAEIVPALEGGLLDAVEWTTASGVLSLGLPRVAARAVVPAVWQPAVLSDFLINKAAWDGLEPDLQAILANAMEAFTLDATAASHYADMEAFRTMEAMGMDMRLWTPAELEVFRTATERVRENYKVADPFSRRVLEAKEAFQKEYEDYTRYFGPYH